MLQLTLDKKDLKKFVKAMLKQGKVRGPVIEQNQIVLGDISEKSGLSFDFTNFKLPLKREFFPQCEVISRYDAKGNVQEVIGHENMVIFGVRPCDTQALTFLDKVFCDDRFTDPYYKQRRDNTLVITLACSSPEASCFCSSTKGGPAAKIGTDIIAFNLGKALLFESVSTKGEAFLKKNKAIFRESTAKEIEARKKQEIDAGKLLTDHPVSDAPKALKKKVDAAVWDRLTETCLGCGACTFLCPTCHCFDLFDEKQAEGGRKLKVHDACMFTSFAREASGHNPRTKKGERMRQRIMHKFSYTQENFNEVFCVGCGRCIVNCPSNIDVRETLAKVTA